MVCTTLKLFSLSAKIEKLLLLKDYSPHSHFGGIPRDDNTNLTDKMFFHEERIMGNKDKCYDVPVDKENEKLKQRLFAGVDSAPL